MPKVGRKDTGGATHAAERGPPKTQRAHDDRARMDDSASVAAGVPGFWSTVNNPRPGPLSRVSVARKGDAVERPRSPDSPLTWSAPSSAFGVETAALVPESDEVLGRTAVADDVIRRTADILVAAVRRQANRHGDASLYVNQEKFKLLVLERIRLMRTRRAVPGPGAEAAETVRQSAREILVSKTNEIRCVQRDPAAPMGLASVHPGVRVESYNRSSDMNMVTDPSEVVSTEPSEDGHMLRPDGAPCATMQLGKCWNA